MQSYFKRTVSRSFYFFLFLALHLRSAAQNFAQVDTWLEKNIETMGGRALLLVWKDGQVVYSNSVSQRNTRQKVIDRFAARRRNKEPLPENLTPTTRLPLASCSKWYSAALVMMFVDEGRLRLSDTVGRWLPVLTQHGKGSITISQCLAHLTGIKTPPLGENIANMQAYGSMNEAIASIARLPVEGAPGTVFRYGNTGLQIAGAVLEKISGKSFETLFAERLAGPLQMKNTDFGNGPVALVAGGAQGTGEDYLHFLEMILQKGLFRGQRILNQESVQAMQVDRLTPAVDIAYTPAEAGNFGYGFGEWIMKEARSDSHSNAVCSPGLFGSFPWVDNEKGYSAILVSYNLQSNGRHQRYKSLKEAVDKALGKARQAD